MSSTNHGKKSMGMGKRACALGIFLAAALLVLAAAPKLWATAFSDARIILEINGTDGDAGIQMFVDGDGWDHLEVFDPNGVQVLDVQGSGSVGTQGLTELFFESAEPSFEDLPLDEMLELFPEGNYTFRGRTVDGKILTGKARLSHNLPAAPEIVFPAEEATLPSNLPVVIGWAPVTGPFPGGNSSVTIVGYQVIVDRLKSKPQRVFSVNLPASITHVTISPEFIEANAQYKFEVLAIEASGNQTISESTFKTQ